MATLNVEGQFRRAKSKEQHPKYSNNSLQHFMNFHAQGPLDWKDQSTQFNCPNALTWVHLFNSLTTCSSTTLSSATTRGEYLQWHTDMCPTLAPIQRPESFECGPNVISQQVTWITNVSFLWSICNLPEQKSSRMRWVPLDHSTWTTAKVKGFFYDFDPATVSLSAEPLEWLNKLEIMSQGSDKLTAQIDWNPFSSDGWSTCKSCRAIWPSNETKKCFLPGLNKIWMWESN